MKTQPAKVLILNCVVQNGGDAAILCAIVGQLRKAFGDDVQITAFDMSPNDGNRLFPDLAHFLPDPLASLKDKGRLGRRLSFLLMIVSATIRSSPAGKFLDRMKPVTNKSLQAYLNADVIVSTGGTYLVDHYNLKTRIISFLFSRLSNKPTVLYTQSMGPFTKKSSRRMLPRVFKHVKHVFLRDTRSQTYLADICPNLPSTVCHDVVFDFQVPHAKPPKRDRPLVLVSVRSWKDFSPRELEEGRQVYRRSIARAVERLVLEANVDIKFVSTCQGLETYHLDDSKEAHEIAGLISTKCQQHVEVVCDFRTPEQLVELLATADFVVSTRMHMAILSLNHEVPCFAVAYEFKTRELYINLGIEKFQVDIGAIAPDSFATNVINAFNNRLAIKSSLSEKLPDVRMSSRQPLNFLTKIASQIGR